MFIVSLTYTKPIEEVEKYFEAHLVFLNTNYSAKKFIVSGRKNPRTGGIILAHHSTLDELQEIIKDDPFYQNQVADYEIIEFIPTKFDEDFEKFIG
mgnify:CR=1 FL=1